MVRLGRGRDRGRGPGRGRGRGRGRDRGRGSGSPVNNLRVLSNRSNFRRARCRVRFNRFPRQNYRNASSMNLVLVDPIQKSIISIRRRPLATLREILRRACRDRSKTFPLDRDIEIRFLGNRASRVSRLASRSK